MKKLYFVSGNVPDYGEVEGMLTEDNRIIDWWSPDDAKWRNEYFSDVMKYLGVIVDTKNDKKRFDILSGHVYGMFLDDVLE